MKLKRLISGVAAIAIVLSSLSFSSAAVDLNIRPGQVGYVPYGMRQDSDDFDFTEKPYSLTSGDYYMGLCVQTSNWAFRNAIGSEDDKGQSAPNVNKEVVKGINPYCPWAKLYMNVYAMIDRDKNGVELKSAVGAYGPAGIMSEPDENDAREILEYAKINDAMIGDNGKYTVGIQGFNFKADTASNYEGQYGNGLNQLFISSNIDYLKKNGVTINNPVLKLYNTKEDYEAKKPYKTVSTDFWITGVGSNATGYSQYTFTNLWAKNGDPDKENGGTFNIPAKAQSKSQHLDAFQVSGFTGKASSEFTETKYEGCQFLPEYAMEIEFDVSIPDSMKTGVISKPLENVLNEVLEILNDEEELATIQGKNPDLTVEQIKEKLSDVYTAAKSVYDNNSNYKGMSKTLVAEVQAKLDKAVEDLKAVCSEFGILIWGELDGYVDAAEVMDASQYTEDSWAALEEALEDAKDLRERYNNGDKTITQEQIDAATAKLKAAIENLKEITEKVDSTSGFGYIQFKDNTGKYKWYNDGKNYANVSAKTVNVVTSEDGNGKTYTVEAICDGKATGLADCNLEIQGLIGAQSGAAVTIDEVTLDGKKQNLTGVPYTQVVDEANAFVPLYDAEATEIPDDAYTSPDGELANDASPQALSQGAKKDYAAIDTEWKELAVKFTVNWTDDVVDENNSENPDTAGGIAVAASLLVVLGAGYVVSRKRMK